MLLSDKYWDYIDTPARAEFLEGSTASGKTTTVAVKFIMNVAESDMKLHVIAGNTTGVIEKNIINADMGLLQISESIESKSRIFLIAERFLKRYNNLVTLSRRTVT